MNKRTRNAIILAAVFILSFTAIFLLCSRIYMSYGPIILPEYSPAVPQLGLSFIAAFLIAFLVALLVLRVRIPIVFAYVALTAYILALALVLFGKSVGSVSGINLNPFESEILTSGFVMNALVFIPMGILLQILLKRTWKSVISGLAISVLVEILQYMFALGIADIVDVAANVLGTLIGICAIKTFVSQDSTVAISKKEIYVYKKDNLASKSKAPAIALGGCCLILACLAVFNLMSPNASSEFPEEEIMQTLEINNGVLASLDVDDAPSVNPIAEINEHVDFSFNGISNTDSWIKNANDGLFQSDGTIDQMETWYDAAGDQCIAITLACKEYIENIEVVHGLPIIITPNTTISYGGKAATASDLLDNFDEVYESKADCVYKFQAGWLEAKSVSITDIGKVNSDSTVQFDYEKYDDYLKTSPNSQPLISLGNGESQEINAELISISDMPDSGSYCTVQFDDLLEGVPIVHSTNIAFEGEEPDYPEDSDTLSTFNVVFNDGKISLQN